MEAGLRSRMFKAPSSHSRFKKKNKEPEPLPKICSFSTASLEIVLGKIASFYG